MKSESFETFGGQGRRGTHHSETEQFLTSGTVKKINNLMSNHSTNQEPTIQYKEKPFSLYQSCDYQITSPNLH